MVWMMTTIDIRQVPKHPSLEAAPAYQGLPHREIRHIPTKILHISGGIYRWWDDHIAPIQMWCFQTKKHIWVPGLFLEHLVLQKSPKLMRPDSGWRTRRDKNPMRPDFRFKVVAQDPTPKIWQILHFLGTNLDEFIEIVHPRIGLMQKKIETQWGSGYKFNGAAKYPIPQILSQKVSKSLQLKIKEKHPGDKCEQFSPF